MSWTPRRFNGKVLYDFKPQGEYQIELSKDDIVEVYEQSTGWLKGAHAESGRKGIFPASYVEEIKEDESSGAFYKDKLARLREGKENTRSSLAANRKPLPDLKQSSTDMPKSSVTSSTVTVTDTSSAASSASSSSSAATKTVDSSSSSSATKSADTSSSTAVDGMGDMVIEEDENKIAANISLDALHTEIRNCMKEWSGTLQQELNPSRSSPDYYRIKERMSNLLALRSELLRVSDEQEQERLRNQIIQLIESSRKLQEGYMVPRIDSGEMADVTNTGVVELLDLHREMYKTIASEQSTGWQQQASRRRTVTVARQRTDPTIALKKIDRTPLPPGNLQLMLDVKAIIYSAQEPTEIYFSLYSQTTNRFLSEPFLVKLTDRGMPENLALLDNMKTLFRDVTSDDWEGLYLVAYVYRVGDLVYDLKKRAGKASEGTIRRPYAAAATKLTELGLEAQLTMPKETTMSIFTNRGLLENAGKYEHDFFSLHEKIITSDKSIEIVPKSTGIAVALTLYAGGDTDVRGRHELEEKKVPSTLKLDFPEVLDPSELRNDFYVFLHTGSLSGQDGKKSDKNIRITVRVIDQQGKLVPDCISRASGFAMPQLTEYESLVFYHTNQPRLYEPLRLSISPDVFEKCSLHFTYEHVSSKKSRNFAFAVSTLALTTEKGAVIADGEHEMKTCKCDKKVKEPFVIKDPTPRKGESFTVMTKLLSTKKTQNDTIHALFNYPKYSVDDVGKFLRDFARDQRQVGELAKFLRQIFDVLFSLLVSKDHQSLQQLVFEAIVHALSLFTHRTISQYRPIVDQYINTLFHEPQAHHVMIRLAKEKLDMAVSSKPDPKTMDLCKSLNYVVRFIGASRRLDKASASPSCDDSTFSNSLLDMLQTTNKLVEAVDEKKADSASGYLKASRGYLVKGFASLVEDLTDLFDPNQLGQFARTFILSIPPVESQNINKLNVIRQLLAGPVGAEKGARDVVLEVILDTIADQLLAVDQGDMNEPYLSLAVLNSLLAIVQSTENVNEQTMWQVARLLPSLSHCVVAIQRGHLGEIALKPVSDDVRLYVKVDTVVDSTTILFAILQALSDAQLQRFVDEMDSDNRLQFVDDMLALFGNCINIKLYEELWVVMNMFQLRLAARMVAQFNPVLSKYFSPQSEDFSRPLWNRYFDLCLGLLTAESLALESFSFKKRQFVTERYGDLRDAVMVEFSAMWKSLGDRQVGFSGHLIGPLFEIVPRSSNNAVITAALDAYYDMLRSEFKRAQGFVEVERHTIDALYNTANKSQQDGDNLMQIIQASVNKRMQSDETLKGPLTEFLGHISKMFELMSSLLKFPDTELYEDERTSVALRLMKYLDESGHERKEMSSRYTQYLVDMHVGLGNHIEAGMAGLKQVQLLGWSNQMVDKLGNFPEQTESERKEAFYREAIRHFVDGADWERAIALCDELRLYYQHLSFEFDKLADTLTEQARYFRNVVHKERYFPHYFRVVYYGDGFPEDLRDQEFIYRGTNLESITDFLNRLRKKWTDAYTHMSSDPPTADIISQHKQIISVTKVAPEKSFNDRLDKEEKKAADKSVEGDAKTPPSAVQEYREHNGLRCFSYQKLRENTDDFQKMWIRKTILITEETFPTNRRRLAVVDRREELISPLMNAIKSVADKNAEVTAELDKVRVEFSEAGDSSDDILALNHQTLAMHLNGVLRAAVNGGTKLFIDGFLTSNYPKEHPDEASHLQQLRSALLSQIKLMKTGLALFKQVCEKKCQLMISVRKTKKEKAQQDSLVPMCSDLKNAYDGLVDQSKAWR